MFVTDKRTKIPVTHYSFEPDKVYLSLLDDSFYTVFKVYSKNGRAEKYLVNLNTMKGQRIGEVTACKNEFIEVNYSFEIRD